MSFVYRIIWNERDLVVSVTNFTGDATGVIQPSNTIDVRPTDTGDLVYCKLRRNVHFPFNIMREIKIHLYVLRQRFDA